MSSVRLWLHDLSLATKLTAIGVSATAASLLMAAAVLVTFDLFAEYKDEVREMNIIAHVTEFNSTAAVSFGDAGAAAEILGLASRMGSLDVGKDANVVVADGSILEPRTNIKYMFIEGRMIPLTSRHTRLFDSFKDRKASQQE